MFNHAMTCSLRGETKVVHTSRGAGKLLRPCLDQADHPGLRASIGTHERHKDANHHNIDCEGKVDRAMAVALRVYVNNEVDQPPRFDECNDTSIGVEAIEHSA